MEIIKVSNLSKIFGDRVIFKDLNFAVNKGDMIAIMGSSGSGKTSLLNILGLLDTPSSGLYRILGNDNLKPFTSMSLKILRNHIGFLFQNYALLEDKTVSYNLDLVSKNHEDVLSKVGLAGYEKKIVHQLSGGEQQRLALARLLLKKCDLILADEPTGSLDPLNRDLVLDILKAIHKEGTTIIIVTHDPFVAEVCDSVINLDGV